MISEDPAPGRRVRQTAPEYAGTEVHHSLYLPPDWKSGTRYPVMVEYTGNYFPPCGSTGEAKGANLGYGLTGGTNAIWVVMPYVAKGGKRNEVTWWGDLDATVAYCKTNLTRICERFGGDPERVVVCGFSRGAIGCSYIGLADDEIAGLWRGMFAHDHFDGQRKWGYPNSERDAALKRLARFKGGAVFASGGGNDFLKEHDELLEVTFQRVPMAKLFSIPEGPVVHPHTDCWMHKPSEQRANAREWLAQAWAPVKE